MLVVGVIYLGVGWALWSMRPWALRLHHDHGRLRPRGRHVRADRHQQHRLWPGRRRHPGVAAVVHQPRGHPRRLRRGRRRWHSRREPAGDREARHRRACPAGPELDAAAGSSRSRQALRRDGRARDARPSPFRARGTAMEYDVIVAGVGGMGSATAAELAARGAKVLGLDRASIPNDEWLVARGQPHHPAGLHGGSGATCPCCGVPTNAGASSSSGWARPSWSHRRRRCGSARQRHRQRLAGLVCRHHDLEHELLDADALMARVPGLSRARRLRRVSTSPTVASCSASAPSPATPAWRWPDGADLHGHEGITALAARRRWRRGADRARRVPGAAARHQRGRLGGYGCCRTCAHGRARTPGADVVARRCDRSATPSAPSRSSSSRCPEGRYLRLSRVRHPGLQDRPLPPS